MTKRTRIAAVAMLVVLAVVAWTSRNPARSQDRVRWEYCSVARGYTTALDRAEAAITYYTNDDAGFRVERVEALRASFIEFEDLPEKALRRAIARLGGEGWELTEMFQSPYSGQANVPVYYFKRRLP